MSDESSGNNAAIRVVYVEDDERLARLTAHYLGSHGVEVLRVSRGDLAVAEVLRVRPTCRCSTDVTGADAHGGRIELDSAAARGTRARAFTSGRAGSRSIEQQRQRRCMSRGSARRLIAR